MYRSFKNSRTSFHKNARFFSGMGVQGVQRVRSKTSCAMIDFFISTMQVFKKRIIEKCHPNPRSAIRTKIRFTTTVFHVGGRLTPVFGVPDCIQTAVNRFTQGDQWPSLFQLVAHTTVYQMITAHQMTTGRVSLHAIFYTRSKIKFFCFFKRSMFVGYHYLLLHISASKIPTSYVW